MAEKILNTRIQLKYDTLDNWGKSQFNGNDSSKWLKSGEIAVVTLADILETNPNATANQHPLLFKVGTGAHKFSDLPWASALAADVYGWAKQSENDFVKNFLSLKMNDNTTMQSKLDGVFATDAELTTAIGNLRDEINGKIGDLTQLETEAKSDLVSAINEVLNAVEVGGTGSVVTVKKAETATEGSVATYTVQQGGKDVKEKIEIPEMVYDAENAIVVQFQDEEAEVVIGLSIDGTTIEPRTTYVVTPKGLGAAKTELIGGASDTGASNTISGAKKYADNIANTAAAGALDSAKGYADGKFAEVLGATTDEAGAATVHGALKAAAAAQDTIDAFLANADTTQDAIDTLKEIQDFLNSDDGTVQTLIDKVDTNEAAIADIVDGTTKVKDAEHADNADNATNAGHANTATIASSLDAEGVAQVKDIKVNDAVYADNAGMASSLDAQGLSQVAGVKVANATNADKLGNSAAADYLLKAEAQEAYQPKGDYASAAQGAKADSALQSVAAGTGLKVSVKANNSQTIDIDDSVVFVFNCGSASTVI